MFLSNFCFWNDILKKKIQKCLNTTLPDKKYDHYCTNKQKQHSKTHWDCYKAWWTIWKKNNNKHGRMWVVFFKFFNAVLLNYCHMIFSYAKVCFCIYRYVSICYFNLFDSRRSKHFTCNKWSWIDSLRFKSRL